MAKKISSYRNKADKMFQRYLIKKHPFCVMCGAPTKVHHHLFPKSSSSALRFEEDNMVPACTGCHLGFHSSKAPSFIIRLIAIKGLKWALKLNKIKETSFIQPTIGFYKEIIEKLDKYGN